MSVQREIARRVAGHLQDGEIVNLGIGIPTLVADFLDAGSGVVLQTENGMLGVGPAPADGEADAALVNAGKLPITALPGASFFSSSVGGLSVRFGLQARTNERGGSQARIVAHVPSVPSDMTS